MTGALPELGGKITFYGKNGDNEWQFHLGSNTDNIIGTANCGDKQLHDIA